MTQAIYITKQNIACVFCRNK